VRIPIGAVYDRGNGPGVWIVVRDGRAGDTVTWRDVTVGGVDAEFASITAGIQPGDTIVALGAHLLDEGRRVRPEQTAESASR
jgi:membrane-associated protease RseP (regulator of RpoE activity)